MNETTFPTSAPPQWRALLGAIPKAVWAAFAALALTTAALGGALVEKSASMHSVGVPGRSELPARSAGPAEAGNAQAMAKANGEAATRQYAVPAQVVAQAPQQRCSSCGTVESVHAMKVKGKSTGLGVVGGALAGGLVGHQLGGGSGKTALTIAGAAGGALAGREVERNVRASTVYSVRVRMQDGSVRTFHQSTPVAEGTAVQVQGKRLRVAHAAQPPRAAG